MKTRHLTSTALLASALVLTACGGGTDSAGSAPGSGSSTSAETATGNDADIAFLTGMKPHHEQAVEMSEMVLAADPPAEVAAIPEQIRDAQSPEIDRMEEMLTDLDVEAEGGGGHSMGDGSSMGGAGHGGMMSGAMMAELDAATGAGAARLYLEGMIRHHEGAIEASDAELADGQYEPALELAQEIEQAQATEITEMEDLLASL